MTVQKEEPELLVAICDGCGERRILDLDQQAEGSEITSALESLGWCRRNPERQKFPGDGKRLTIIYEQDFCADCESEEARPKPLFGSGRPVIQSVGDAFANDPCDEWPRSLVFASIGLRSDCGHPRGARFSDCAYCAAGYAIGHSKAWWQL
jgi:hypothetical protein